MKVLSQVVVYTGASTYAQASKVLFSNMQMLKGNGGRQMIDLVCSMSLVRVVTAAEL